MLTVAVVGVAGGWWAAGGSGTSEPDVSASSDETGQEPGDTGAGTDAAGTDGTTAPPGQPPLTDARAWRRVAHDETVFGGDDSQVMHAVTNGGPGLVAVGGDSGLQAAAVWTSTDGAVWQRVAHDETVFGGDGQQLMVSVTVGGPGLVAVGDDYGRRAAAVWTSANGLVWQRVAHDEAVFGGTGLQPMSSVTVGGASGHG